MTKVLINESGARVNVERTRGGFVRIDTSQNRPSVVRAVAEGPRGPSGAGSVEEYDPGDLALLFQSS